MKHIAQKHVIIFGVGGVGSWCAEGLIRSGIRHLTIVDSDRVCITNINRQLMATTKTVGQVKVEALRERLLSINPSAEITALQQIFSEESASKFHLEDYDYIIDAIDSLKDKAALILLACKTKAKLFSSMGAALKLDPTRIKVTEFWKVQGDPWHALSVRNLSTMDNSQRRSSKLFIAMNCWRILDVHLMMTKCHQPSTNPRLTVPLPTSLPSSVLLWQAWWCRMPYFLNPLYKRRARSEKDIGPAVVRTITGPWCLVAMRGLLLHILCEVGQVHIALACQRVVHGEGGSEVMACLTHL